MFYVEMWTYFDLFEKLLVGVLNSSHIFGGEYTNLAEYLTHSMLDEGICMKVEGGHNFKIFLDLSQYFMFVENDSPWLHPSRHR